MQTGAPFTCHWAWDGRAVTAGADGRIAIWREGEPQADTVLEGHTAPIVALAVSPDGAWLASAAWDHTVRLWPLARDPEVPLPVVFGEAHAGMLRPPSPK